MIAADRAPPAAALPTRDRAAASPWTPALGALAAVSLAALVLFHDAWASMAEIWWSTTTYHHGFLVAPIALFLAWRKRAELAHLEPRQEPLALLPLAGFAGLWLVGKAGDAQLVQHVGAVGVLVSLAGALLGRAACRVLAFPLLFLFLMVPFGDFLIPHLQDFTARFAVGLLRLVGVPVFHDGILIETPSGLFEVAEACAGVRFLIANLVVAALFAHLAFWRAWKWAAFLALGALVPILANGLRAFGIVYVAHLTDNEYAAGVDHLVYGWGFFSAVMLLLLLIGRAFADDPALARDAGAAAPSAAAAGQARRWRLVFLAPVLAALLAAPTYAGLAMRPPPVPAVMVAKPPATAPGSGWRRLPEVDAEGWRPAAVGPDLEVLGAYARDGDGRQADLYVAYYAFERQGAEAVHQGHRFADGKAWMRLAGGRQALRVDSLPATARSERLAAAGGRRHRLVLWWYWVGGAFTADPLRAKLFQVRDRLLGRAQPAAIVAVSVSIEGGGPAATDAAAAAEDLLRGLPLATWLVELGKNLSRRTFPSKDGPLEADTPPFDAAGSREPPA